jgi:hypothetical protein
MQQIADWFKELGMAEYAERFAENHLDSGVLRDLTDQDLKDLGVVSIGHRRKMLRAISELAEARAVPPRPPPTSLSKSHYYAERRQLTGHSGASVGGVITFSEPAVILCQWGWR